MIAYWKPITANEYYDMLGGVPPIYSKTAPRFAPDEPLTHNHRGEPVYHIYEYNEESDSYHESIGTLADMNNTPALDAAAINRCAEINAAMLAAISEIATTLEEMRGAQMIPLYRIAKRTLDHAEVDDWLLVNQSPYWLKQGIRRHQKAIEDWINETINKHYVTKKVARLAFDAWLNDRHPLNAGYRDPGLRTVANLVKKAEQAVLQTAPE